jgi:antitoxin component YwqK of YwqJK toxin-antitoxin module
MSAKSLPDSAPAGKTVTVTLWKPASEVFTYTDGTIDRKITRVYDAEGNLTAVKETDGKDNLLYFREYSRRDGVLVSLQVSDKAGPVSITLYKSDSAGRIVEEVSQGSNKAVLSRLTHRYVGDYLAETVAQDGGGKINLLLLYEYKDGELDRLEYRTAQGTLEATFRRISEGGKVISEQTIVSDGLVETERSFIYSGDRIAGESHFSMGVPVKSVRFEYDGNGNIVREIWADRAGRDYETVSRDWIGIEKVVQELQS